MSVTDIVLAASGTGRPWVANAAFYNGFVPLSPSLVEEANPRGIFYDPSGNYFFTVGTTNDTVYKYFTSTPWDVSTAQYTSESFSVSAQTGSPTDLFFKPDGLKMYVSSGTNIFQYTLPFSFDFTSASYDSVTLDVSAQTTGCAGFFFKPDGTKLYVTSSTTVFQYSLSSAWDLSTATYDSVSFAVSPATLSNAISFKSDGTKMYIASLGGLVHQYSLSSAWNLSTASYDSVTLIVPVFTYGMYFKDDGDRIYILTGFTPDAVAQYRITSAWDLSTAQNKGNYYFTPNINTESSFTFAFKEDGTRFYVSLAGTIYQYSVATAWNLATATYDSVSFSTSSQVSNLRSIFFKPDGTKMYALDEFNRVVYQYSLSPAWDLGTATYDSVSFSVSTQAQTPSTLRFKSDGTKMYVLANFDSTIYQYSLSSAWSLSSATYDSVSFSPSAQGSPATSFFFRPDGTRLLITVDGTLYQYALSSAWDLSSVTYSSVSKSLSSQNITTVNNLWFRSNGTRMFVLQRLPGSFILQYEVA